MHAAISSSSNWVLCTSSSLLFSAVWEGFMLSILWLVQPYLDDQDNLFILKSLTLITSTKSFCHVRQSIHRFWGLWCGHFRGDYLSVLHFLHSFFLRSSWEDTAFLDPLTFLLCFLSLWPFDYFMPYPIFNIKFLFLRNLNL